MVKGFRGEGNASIVHLITLLIISIISHFPFVLKGFGEIDATKIAVSVIDMINHGPDSAFANFYFTDVVPLYILYLKLFMKFLDYNYSYLPLVMNYTNAVFGILTVIPAFLLIKHLFRDSLIAFCSVLVLLFAPSFYQSTIMGFPHLIALFFLLISFLLYLAGIDHTSKKTFFIYMILACIFLTITLLFKSDYILASGFYIGILFIRKIKDRIKIISPFLVVMISGILFLIFRKLILLSHTGGTTMSREALSRWYHFSLAIPRNLDSLITQVGPIAYAFGIATFLLSIIAIIYLLYKKRFDILIFVLSWTALPIFFWAIMIGNNARHNMLSVLPVIVVIICFFHERFRKGIVIMAIVLILANYFILSPSPSIIRPSGNLIKSHALIKERADRFKVDATKVVQLEDKKKAVLGYFHNPHVIFEILYHSPSYKAEKIGREDYWIKAEDKEYVFVYFVAMNPDELVEGIKEVLERYNLYNYSFVSATYDLTSLKDLGFKTETVDVIPRRLL